MTISEFHLCRLPQRLHNDTNSVIMVPALPNQFKPESSSFWKCMQSALAAQKRASSQHVDNMNQTLPGLSYNYDKVISDKA